jgi:hypothetical protein
LSSRTNLLRVNRPQRHQAHLLELLYLACALLLGALLAATTLAAAPLQTTHDPGRRGEHVRHARATMSPASRLAPRAAMAAFDSK